MKLLRIDKVMKYTNDNEFDTSNDQYMIVRKIHTIINVSTFGCICVNSNICFKMSNISEACDWFSYARDPLQKYAQVSCWHPEFKCDGATGWDLPLALLDVSRSLVFEVVECEYTATSMLET